MSILDDSDQSLPDLIRIKKSPTPRKPEISPRDPNFLELPNILKNKLDESKMIEPKSPNKKNIQKQEHEKSFDGQSTHSPVHKINIDKSFFPKKIELSKQKQLIETFFNKISSSSMSQQPITITIENQNRIMRQIEKQKQQVIRKIDNYNKMQGNTNNTVMLMKQYGSLLKKNLEFYQIMKQLYKERLKLKIENSNLKAKINNMKQQNKEIKQKISQGILQIESYMHNAPCQKQKHLAEELKKCRQQLSDEKQMRINLQINIQKTIENFNRFYVEADTARKILVSQLKQKNSQFEHTPFQIIKNQRTQQQSIDESDHKSPIKKKQNPLNLKTDQNHILKDNFGLNHSPRIVQSKKLQTGYKRNFDEQRRSPDLKIIQGKKIKYIKQIDTSNSKKNTKSIINNNQQNMQYLIKKMRNNRKLYQQM